MLSATCMHFAPRIPRYLFQNNRIQDGHRSGKNVHNNAFLRVSFEFMGFDFLSVHKVENLCKL